MALKELLQTSDAINQLLRRLKKVPPRILHQNYIQPLTLALESVRVDIAELKMATDYLDTLTTDAFKVKPLQKELAIIREDDLADIRTGAVHLYFEYPAWVATPNPKIGILIRIHAFAIAHCIAQSQVLLIKKLATILEKKKVNLSVRKKNGEDVNLVELLKKAHKKIEENDTYDDITPKFKPLFKIIQKNLKQFTKKLNDLEHELTTNRDILWQIASDPSCDSLSECQATVFKATILKSAASTETTETATHTQMSNQQLEIGGPGLLQNKGSDPVRNKWIHKALTDRAQLIQTI